MENLQARFQNLLSIVTIKLTGLKLFLPGLPSIQAVCSISI